jgi:hypothetical protein
MLNKLLVSQHGIYPTSDRHSDLRGGLHTHKNTAGYSSDDNIDVRRQRRRIDDNDHSFQQRNMTSSASAPGSAVPKDSTRIFTSQEAYPSLAGMAGNSGPLHNWNSSVDNGTVSGEGEWVIFIGQ